LTTLVTVDWAAHFTDPLGDHTSLIPRGSYSTWWSCLTALCWSSSIMFHLRKNLLCWYLAPQLTSIALVAWSQHNQLNFYSIPSISPRCNVSHKLYCTSWCNRCWRSNSRLSWRVLSRTLFCTFKYGWYLAPNFVQTQPLLSLNNG
jgi:hypothetical protein